MCLHFFLPHAKPCRLALCLPTDDTFSRMDVPSRLQTSGQDFRPTDGPPARRTSSSTLHQSVYFTNLTAPLQLSSSSLYTLEELFSHAFGQLHVITKSPRDQPAHSMDTVHAKAVELCCPCQSRAIKSQEGTHLRGLFFSRIRGRREPKGVGFSWGLSGGIKKRERKLGSLSSRF